MRWFKSNKDTSTDRSPGGSLMLPQIVAANLKSVADLDGAHYVFLLTFNTGEQVVLKAEAGVNTDAKSGGHDLGVKIMGFVSAVKAEALTPFEKQQVDLIDTGISRDFFRAEQFIKGGQGNWVKAAFQSDLAGLKGNAQILTKGDDGFDHVDPQKKAKATADMVKMNLDLKGNTKAWRSLGEVIAADMLIANSDRINLGFGQFTNLGNVQFRRSGKKIVGAVGLDTFDPSQAESAGDMYGTNIKQWQDEFGIYLKEPGTAKTQLKACMDHGVGEINRIFGVGTCEWGAKETSAIQEGFASGVATLRKRMKQEGPKLINLGSKAPKGLVLKLNWLGWI